MTQKVKIGLSGDTRGVSPVLGVIMMIAVVALIAAFVAAVAYGIIGGVNKAPSTAMVVEGVHPGSDVSVSLFHHGGDTITEAFHENNTIAGRWNNLEIRKNGAIVEGNATVGIASGLWLNDVPYSDTWTNLNFESGDMLRVEFKRPLQLTTHS